MTLVLLHGFTGAPASWDEVACRLPRAVRVLRPTLGAAASFDAEVDRLAALLHAEGAAPAHVAGYSMGARVALRLALRHPEGCARLTLIGVHPGLEDDAERAERARADERWAALLERDGIAAFACAWDAQPLFASQAALPTAVRDRQRALRLRQDPAALARTLRALSLARMPAAWAELTALAAPACFVAGDGDPRFVRLAVRAAALCRDATARVVAGAGHNVVLERPDAVAALVSEGVTA